MKVLHLTKGRKYDIWAMCSDDDTCQVLEFLRAVPVEHTDLVETIAALLYEVAPHEAPPLDDPRRAKMLYRDLIYELKADKDLPRRKHLGLRIAFFFDGSVLICTNAFLKSRGTPQAELDKALLERARYYEGKHELEFVT
jgi:hypothetical protein